MNPSGKLPLGFHHSHRDIEEAVVFFRFCCLLARQSDWPMRTQGRGQHTASASSHLAALHNPHRFWTGPLHPAPSHSARSRRTSHGPRADCFFRLAIFELTRSTAFQPQEERRTPPSRHSPVRRTRSSHLPVQNDFLGKGGTLCGKQYVQ